MTHLPEHLSNAPAGSAGTAPARRAFTLLEVLVVVAIIAMLSAILLPSLAKSRRQAQAVACQSNMRQLGLALQMYAQTQQNRLVSGGFTHEIGRASCRERV